MLRKQVNEIGCMVRWRDRGWLKSGSAGPEGMRRGRKLRKKHKRHHDGRMVVKAAHRAEMWGYPVRNGAKSCLKGIKGLWMGGW